MKKLPPVPAADLWCAYHMKLVPTKNIIHTEMLDELVTDVGRILDDIPDALTAARELLL
jgi:hypothetical protein